MKITEKLILEKAQNIKSVENGRSLSKEQKFFDLKKLEDETLYWANCRSSGSKNYFTSLDFSNNDIIYRCNCPSRKFPCKHSIGLMFEILENKSFIVDKAPEDLILKREKKITRESAKNKNLKVKNINKSAQTKKIKKQLEGLNIVEKLIKDLLNQGIGTLAGTSIDTYEKLAKDLGNYYLIGAQTALLRLVKEMKKIQSDSESTNYSEVVRILIWLNSLIKKSREYLNNKLEDNNFSNNDNILFEALGGIWKLNDLEMAGLFKENVKIIQLSFDIYLDNIKKEYVDCGYWLELDTGNIYRTFNYRPIKALKHIKSDDTCFDVLNVEKLFYYPGNINSRIRWEKATIQQTDENIISIIIDKAEKDLINVIKKVKNEIKNTLSEKFMGVLISFKQIGKIEDKFVLEDNKGNRIILKNNNSDVTDNKIYNCIKSLELLPNNKLLKNQVLFGIIFYDYDEGRLYLEPNSIISKNQIIRLKY